MSQIPRFSIIYASCRPKEIVEHYALWERHTKFLNNCEFIFAVDELDATSREAAQKIVDSCAEKAKTNGNWWTDVKLCVVPAPSRNCIVAWNTAAKVATGQVFMVTSDDFVIPFGWDETFSSLKCSCTLPGFWWEHPHVVHTNDGHTSIRHGICTFPIITRGWYRWTGYIYHPSYTELFGDQELCESGYQKKVMIPAHDIMIEHRHYTVHKRGFDEHDERHSTREAWNKDEANFLKRRAAGFPTEVET